MILDVADEQHKRDIISSCVIIEVVHSVFDSHTCAQWIRIYRDPRTNDCIIKYKNIPFRYRSEEDFQRTGVSLIILTMLHDFMEYIDTNVMTDMDFLTINVHYKGQRISILHNYLNGEVYKDDICDTERYRKDRVIHKVVSSFRKQISFGCRALYFA